VWPYIYLCIKYKPYTYFKITGFFRYLYTRPIFYRIGLPRPNQMRFIHNWVIKGIQWMMVCWRGLLAFVLCYISHMKKKLVSLCTLVVLQVECQKGLTSSVISYIAYWQSFVSKQLNKHQILTMYMYYYPWELAYMQFTLYDMFYMKWDLLLDSRDW
jgi:hypothetical protein